MKSFWIKNISNRLISLGDLGILMQPYQAINLLDSKHYFFNEKQIQESLKSGSLYKRSDKIVVMKVVPIKDKTIGPGKVSLETKQEYPSKVRSLLEHKEFNYEELGLSDDQYADENSEFADEDDIGRFKK